MDLNYTPEEEGLRADVRAFLRAKLPPNVEPGYDGMRVEFDGT